MPYITELMAFPVLPGKEARAAEWLEMLVARQAECVATLDREAMHFESIFRVNIAERLHLCWFSAQGNAGAHVSTSTFEVDQLHMQFWRECIDPSAPPISFEHVVNFVPPAVAEAIAQRENSLAQGAA